MSVDRRHVRPQAVQIHRPPEPAAAAAQQTHPYGRAPHRGEGPVALLEGAARRTRSAAFVGPDVALGTFARGALCGPARDHRQYDLCDRRGDPFAARDIEQPLAACTQRFRTGARRAELHRQERGDARREDTLHDEPPHGALRYGYRGDPLPRDLRADKQLAQARRLHVDQPVAVAERLGAGSRLYGRRARVQSAGDDGLRHGAFEHLVAHQFAGRDLRHFERQGQRHARRDPGQYAAGAGDPEAQTP